MGSWESRSKTKHGEFAEFEPLFHLTVLCTRTDSWHLVVLWWTMGLHMCRGAIEGSAHVLATDVAASDLVILLAFSAAAAKWMV